MPRQDESHRRLTASMLLKPALLVLVTCAINICVMSLFLGERDAFGTGSAVDNGDVNGDRTLNIADPVYMLAHLFNGGPPPVAIAGPACPACDFTQAEVDLLKDLAANHLSIEFLDDGTGSTNKTVRFTGINVQIVDGSGDTIGLTNGLGNLIVGYNETGNFNGDIRTGSHNIVGGASSSYSSFGGLIVGATNTISAEFASVTGGANNTASGTVSSVTGGQANEANAQSATVTGGSGNTASGLDSSVTGGRNNTASGDWSSVNGGGGGGSSTQSNIASGDYATVSGGEGNTATGETSTVSGGGSRTASGAQDWVGGGLTQDF